MGGGGEGAREQVHSSFYVRVGPSQRKEAACGRRSLADVDKTRLCFLCSKRPLELGKLKVAEKLQDSRRWMASGTNTGRAKPKNSEAIKNRAISHVFPMSSAHSISEMLLFVF